ncbi:MAG: hypothetical protein EXR51_02055 [Dehalococcoidia bacterium]|nr:hypothetical protein [Dehalococcoidia bacterium]
MRFVTTRASIVVLSALLFAGCGFVGGPSGTPAPRPTATATPERPTPTPTLAPAPPGGACAFTFHPTAQTKSGDPPAARDPVIKGTINDGSNRIYFVPGMRRYRVEQVDEQQGERWFCTEQEAVAAGWKASAAPRS